MTIPSVTLRYGGKVPVCHHIPCRELDCVNLALGDPHRTRCQLLLSESLRRYAGDNAVTRAGNAYDLPLDSRMKLQEVGGRILTAAESGARWLN